MNLQDCIILLLFLVFTILFAIVKSYWDNKRWEKHIYQILKQYRSKYGVDKECEYLVYKKDTED